MPIIDHSGLTVSDIAKAKRFYAEALAPLGIVVAMEFPKAVTGSFDVVGFGKDGKPEFWLAEGGKASPRLHFAFVAANRAEVDAFYKAAMAADGTDNGPPGIRAHYHPNYYAAFVLDPDGNNIEAVCRLPA